jgi:hypothetical protein
MPERVTGLKCQECGTIAGKNVEYQHDPPRVLRSSPDHQGLSQKR